METKWINESMFYHIYPLGFFGCEMENKGGDNQSNKILKLIDYIPHLKRLGITALYIGFEFIFSLKILRIINIKKSEHK